MDELRREVDRAFESFAMGRRPGFRRAAFLPGYGARQYPLVNLYEDKDNLYVEALAPGVAPEKLDLTVRGTTLTISGEKWSLRDVPAEAIHRSERSAGKFVRTVELPYPVDDANVAASYRHGLLIVTLPKHEAAKPKQISVQVG
jgi:HSP20 family protein